MGPISGPRSPQAPSLHTVSQGVGGRSAATRQRATGPGRTLLFAMGPVKPAISCVRFQRQLGPDTLFADNPLSGRAAPWPSRVWAVECGHWAGQAPHGPTPQNPASAGFFGSLSSRSGSRPGSPLSSVCHRPESSSSPGSATKASPPPQPPSGSEPPCSGVQVGQDRWGSGACGGRKDPCKRGRNDVSGPHKTTVQLLPEEPAPASKASPGKEIKFRGFPYRPGRRRRRPGLHVCLQQAASSCSALGWRRQGMETSPGPTNSNQHGRVPGQGGPWGPQDGGGGREPPPSRAGGWHRGQCAAGGWHSGQ